MRAYTNTAPGRMEWRELPIPEPGPGQVRIRTGAVGICATDLEMIAGWWRTGFPTVPGHEWAGIVDAAGPGADPQLVGWPVVAENVWDDGSEVGFEHPGGYAEYFVTDASKVLCLPKEYPLDAAALIEPLAVCVRGWNRLRVPGQGRALVIGDGPIGLMMVALLRLKGFREVGLVGGRPGRLALGRELGATGTLNYHEVPEAAPPDAPGVGGNPILGGEFHAGPLGRAILANLGGPAPVVIEASGSGAAMEAALEAASPMARILVLGDYAQACAKFPWNDLLHREWDIVGSCASAGAWPEAVRLATEEGFPLERFVSHRLPIERFDEGMQIAAKSREALKVVMQWG